MDEDIKGLVVRLQRIQVGMANEEEDAVLAAIAAIEALAGEVEFVKGQLAGTNRNIAGWLKSRDDNLKRAEAAEAERDRLKAALEVAQEAMQERRTYCKSWEWKYMATWDDEDLAVSKALGDAS